MASITTAAEDGSLAEIAEIVARPYVPSWIDRVNYFVERLPGPSWLFYVGVWLGLLAVETGIKWWDGSYPVGTFFAYHVFVVTGAAVYSLAAIQFLDNVASSALRTFRPALATSEAEYVELEYQLTTMPARNTLLASLAGLFLFVVLAVFAADPASLALMKLNTSAPASLLELVLLLVQWSTFGALIYHTIHQLRLVSRIYTTATHINLFRLGALYAFSRLSALNAISWIVIPYAGIASTPGVLGLGSVIATNIPLTILAIIVFVWPLLGIHRLLEAEKSRLQSEAGQQLESTIAKLHQRLQSNDLNDIVALKNGVEAIIMEQSALAKSRTWPWQLGTISGLGAALVLPLILWFLERVLAQLMGF
jgi:hypothetical protein